MLTNFIKQKDVKNKFKRWFEKPKIEKPKILLSDNYNSSLIGNAVDYLIHAKYDYLYKKSGTNTLAFELIAKFEKVKSDFLKHDNPKHYYFTKNGSYIKNRSYNTGKVIKSSEVSFYRIINLFEESLIFYNKFLINGKISEDFLKSILILAQIMPGIHYGKIGSMPGKVLKNDIKVLRKLIPIIPKEMFTKKISFLSSPNLSLGLIDGRPDYIFDDLLLEVKTTKAFFQLNDFYQIVGYYLLYLNKKKQYQSNNIEVKRLGIYYILYGRIIYFDPKSFFSKVKFNEVINWINQRNKKYDYLYL